MLKFYPKSLAVTINSRKFAAVLKFGFMQTVNLQYNVPAGYSLEEFVAKVNSYVAAWQRNVSQERSMSQMKKRKRLFVKPRLT